MSVFEQIKKLRALEKNSPYEGERSNAKKKADALEVNVQYEPWMGELSEIFNKNLTQEQSEELLNMLIEQYYKDGYIGNEYYIEFLKEGACCHFKEKYHPKCEPQWSDEEKNGHVVFTELEDICLTAEMESCGIAYDYLNKNSISIF